MDRIVSLSGRKAKIQLFAANNEHNKPNYPTNTINHLSPINQLP
jgi:hypothetical protein